MKKILLLLISLAFPMLIISQEDTTVTDIVYVDSIGYFFSDNSSIYYKDVDCDTIVRLFDSECSRIRFCPSEVGVYYYDDGDTELFFFSFLQLSKSKLCQFQKPINDITIVNKDLIVAHGNSIGLIEENINYVTLFRTDTIVTALAATKNGTLLYGTPKGLFYYNGGTKQLQLSNLNIRRLIATGNDLYPICSDGKMTKLPGVLASYDTSIKNELSKKSLIKRIMGDAPPRLMTYIGGSATKDAYTLYGRIGVYTSTDFSASLNVSLGSSNKNFMGSFGFSGYKTWGFLVTGVGFSDMIVKNKHSFSFTPSLGLSFANNNRQSSFDIMLNWYVPFESGEKQSYGISLGKTIYFDLEKLIK